MSRGLDALELPGLLIVNASAAILSACDSHDVAWLNDGNQTRESDDK